MDFETQRIPISKSISESIIQAGSFFSGRPLLDTVTKKKPRRLPSTADCAADGKRHIKTLFQSRVREVTRQPELLLEVPGINTIRCAKQPRYPVEIDVTNGSPHKADLRIRPDEWDIPEIFTQQLLTPFSQAYPLFFADRIWYFRPDFVEFLHLSRGFLTLFPAELEPLLPIATPPTTP